jgi:threonine aldolase
MRQIGLLAAAADYAVEHHWPLLKKDHSRASRFAKELDASEAFTIDLDTVESNIILFDPVEGLATDWVQTFGDNGIGVVPFGKHTIRATLHFQITDSEFEQVLEFVRSAEA